MQVSADGPQTRDISLPWNNSQIDAARRTFLDRHPLAKNKEQVALAKGEGMLLVHSRAGLSVCWCGQAFASTGIGSGVIVYKCLSS